MIAFRFNVTVIGVFMVLLCGCGQPGHDRIEISGLVTLDGAPLPGGMIVKFTPTTGGGNPAIGSTDLNGKYAMYADQGKIGLYPGEYQVSIEIPFADQNGPYTGPPELAKFKIPKAYSTGASTLVFQVPDDGSTLDIAMTSK